MKVVLARVLSLALLVATSSHAGPIEFAPEFNFQNQDLIDAYKKQKNRNHILNSTSEKMRDTWAQLVAKKCPECLIKKVSDKYGADKVRVTYPNGWYFEITLDPAVIEITSKPNTVEGFRSLEKVIQRDIWDTANELNLKPSGSGHINIGKESAFGSNALLFRNFFVDYLNHIELSRGIHYYAYTNAPHIEDLRASHHSEKLRSILRDFDAAPESIEGLSKKIVSRVYTQTNFLTPVSPRYKYHAFNLSTIAYRNAWPRVELRAMRMQKNFTEFVAMIELFEKRIEYLSTLKRPLQYQAWRLADKSKLSEAKAVARYYEYVKNSGLSWDTYANLLPDEYNNALSRFHSSCHRAFQDTLSNKPPQP